jgi:hypothetical protein
LLVTTVFRSVSEVVAVVVEDSTDVIEVVV